MRAVEVPLGGTDPEVRRAQGAVRSAQCVVVVAVVVVLLLLPILILVLLKHALLIYHHYHYHHHHYCHQYHDYCRRYYYYYYLECTTATITTITEGAPARFFCLQWVACFPTNSLTLTPPHTKPG